MLIQLFIAVLWHKALPLILRADTAVTAVTAVDFPVCISVRLFARPLELRHCFFSRG